jgi:hypothetical protein
MLTTSDQIGGPCGIAGGGTQGSAAVLLQRSEVCLPERRPVVIVGDGTF